MPKQTVDFESQVMPLFSKHGCNAAECHGSATGRGDFKLSLFGGDPDRDYQAIVHHLQGRRVNFEQPSKSLLLTKPLEMLAHGGGEVFAEGSVAAARIRDWIKSGARREAQVRITGIAVETPSLIAKSDEQTFQIRVLAHTNRGRLDVTEDASFSTTHPIDLEVSESGRVRVLRSGQFFVNVKYLRFATRVKLIRSFSDQGQSPKTIPDSWRTHPIDRLAQKAFGELGLQFPNKANEAIFLRRLFLDLTGKLPSPEQVSTFLESKDLNKKNRLVNQLLESPEFSRYWAFWLRGVIQFRRPGNDLAAAQALDHWLVQTIKNGQSWSDTTRDLLLSMGDTEDLPAANFHRFFEDSRAEAEVVASSFLGFQIGCANCHNHPLDQWTQEDYHGLAQIFATIQRGKKITELTGGFVIQPKTGKPAVAKIPGLTQPLTDASPREMLVSWMLDSTRFKQAMANRLWQHFMGRGLVEPVDDFRVSNPPLDARMLVALADNFEKEGFRFRPLIRQIVTSDLYASQAARGPAAAFCVGYHEKALSPEVLFDICQQVLYETGRDKLNREAISDLKLIAEDESFRLLKGCEPQGDCSNFVNRVPEFGLREKLNLVNGQFINRWIHDEENRFHRSLKNSKSTIEIIAELYSRAFSRKMTDNELEFWEQQLKLNDAKPGSSTNRIALLQDAIWSLLNSKEFQSIR